MDLHEIVSKLAGPIAPIGDSGYDDRAYENLKVVIDLADSLLAEIIQVSSFQGRHEGSMDKAGAHASEFLKEVHSYTRKDDATQ